MSHVCNSALVSYSYIASRAAFDSIVVTFLVNSQLLQYFLWLFYLELVVTISSQKGLTTQLNCKKIEFSVHAVFLTVLILFLV